MKEREKIYFTDIKPSDWQNERTGGHAGVSKVSCIEQGVSEDTCIYVNMELCTHSVCTLLHVNCNSKYSAYGYMHVCQLKKSSSRITTLGEPELGKQ